MQSALVHSPAGSLDASPDEILRLEREIAALQERYGIEQAAAAELHAARAGRTMHAHHSDEGEELDSIDASHIAYSHSTGSIPESPDVPPRSRKVSGSGRTGPKPGSSCHQCKSSKPDPQLLFCTNREKDQHKKRKCRKKFCQACMKRCYPNHIPPGWDPDRASAAPLQWTCPSCKHICQCASCSRKGFGLHADSSPTDSDRVSLPAPPHPSRASGMGPSSALKLSRSLQRLDQAAGRGLNFDALSEQLQQARGDSSVEESSYSGYAGSGSVASTDTPGSMSVHSSRHASPRMPLEQNGAYEVRMQQTAAGEGEWQGQHARQQPPLPHANTVHMPYRRFPDSADQTPTSSPLSVYRPLGLSATPPNPTTRTLDPASSPSARKRKFTAPVNGEDARAVSVISRSSYAASPSPRHRALGQADVEDGRVTGERVDDNREELLESERKILQIQRELQELHARQRALMQAQQAGGATRDMPPQSFQFGGQPQSVSDVAALASHQYRGDEFPPPGEYQPPQSSPESASQSGYPSASPEVPMHSLRISVRPSAPELPSLTSPLAVAPASSLLSPPPQSALLFDVTPGAGQPAGVFAPPSAGAGDALFLQSPFPMQPAASPGLAAGLAMAFPTSPVALRPGSMMDTTSMSGLNTPAGGFLQATPSQWTDSQLMFPSQAVGLATPQAEYMQLASLQNTPLHGQQHATYPSFASPVAQ